MASTRAPRSALFGHPAARAQAARRPRAGALRAGLVVLPLLALTVACNPNGSSGNGAGTTASPSASNPAVAVRPPPTTSAPTPHFPKARRGGMVGMLFHAARELTLTDDQKAKIDALEEKPIVEEPDAGAPFKDFQVDLETGIRAGKFDMTKMKADFAAVDHVVEARQSQDAEALNGLHGILDAGMRKTLTASVRAKQAAIDARRPPENPDAGMPEWTKRKLDRMTADLTLDPGQQKQVAALLVKGDDSPAAQLAHREESKKRLDSLLTAFESDSFDAKKFDLSMGGAKSPHEPMEHEVTYMTGLLPILHQDQRDKLAAQRSSRPSFGGPFGSRPHMGMDRPGAFGPNMASPAPPGAPGVPPGAGGGTPPSMPPPRP